MLEIVARTVRGSVGFVRTDDVCVVMALSSCVLQFRAGQIGSGQAVELVLPEHFHPARIYWVDLRLTRTISNCCVASVHCLREELIGD